MTDTSVAIPLHFSLEFLGVAALGGLLAWAAQRRFRVLAAGTLLVFVSQVLHAAQFVTGEADTWVLTSRVAGLAVMAAALRLEVGRRGGAGQQSVTAAVATGSPGLAWWSALGAVAVGAGHRTLPDRGLWASGWAGFAAAEVWLAAGGPGTTVLVGDLGLHLVRALGFVLLGAWGARRMANSLRLRVIGAFTLVLFIVVVVAGSAIARVGATDRENDELRRLEVEARSQQESFIRTSDDVVRSSGVVSQSFAGTVDDPGRASEIASIVLEQIYPELSFVVLVSRDRAVIGGSGLEEADTPAVTGSTAVEAALRGEPAPGHELFAGALAVIGASPVYRPGAARVPENAAAAVVVAQRFGDAAVREIGDRIGTTALLLSPGGQVLAGSGAPISRVDVPVEGLRAVADGRTWRGSINTEQGRFLAGAAPVTRPGEPVGASILVARPDTAVAAAALDASRALLGAILAAALMAVVIALWLSSRIARPVIGLTETARRVEEGDLEVTSNVHSTDEIGQLAGAFDSMTSTLRSSLSSEQETRRELQAIVAGMGEGLAAVDEDFNIVSFNPAAEEICGVSAADAVGAKCHDVYGHLTRGPHGQPICEYICPLRHDGGVDSGVVIETADGDIRSLAVTCSALRDADGNLVGGVDLLRDVTAEMQAEQMKSNFLANISHELRTPLAPILGYAQIMRRKEVGGKQREKFLDEIVSSTQRLERIVTILVDVAALEAGQLKVDPQPVPADSILRSTVERWKGRTPNHSLKATVPSSLPHVNADERLVGRVLDELVDNAVKFAPDGGPITLKARAMRTGVEVSVSDKGIGLDAAALERLSAEFVQADPSETRRFGGLGVGLAFVRRIVEAHGGRLDVKSKPGKGSVFSFVLPRATKPRAKAAKTSRKRRGRAKAS